MSDDQSSEIQREFADVDINNGAASDPKDDEEEEVPAPGSPSIENDLFAVTPTSESNRRISSSNLEDVLTDNGDYYIEITVSEPQKVGDDIGSYLAYKVTTKTNIPKFKHNEFSTLRRFSDFLGIHALLAGKYTRLGRIIPLQKAPNSPCFQNLMKTALSLIKKMDIWLLHHVDN